MRTLRFPILFALLCIAMLSVVFPSGATLEHHHGQDDDLAGMLTLPEWATVIDDSTAILLNPSLPHRSIVTAQPGPASDEGMRVAVIIADGHALRFIEPGFMPRFSAKLAEGAFFNNIVWDNACAPNMTPAGFATIFTATCQPVDADVSGRTPPDRPYFWEIGGRDFGWVPGDIQWFVGKARVDSVLRWSDAPGYDHSFSPSTTLILRWVPPLWRDGNDLDVRNASRSALAPMDPKPRLVGEDLAQHDRMCHLAGYNPADSTVGYDNLVESLANSDSLIVQAVDDYLAMGYVVIVTADHHGRGDETHHDGLEWRNHGGDGCGGDENGWAAVFGANVIPGTYVTEYTSRDIGRTVIALEGLPANHPDVAQMTGVVITECFDASMTTVAEPDIAWDVSEPLAVYNVEGRRLSDSDVRASIVDGCIVIEGTSVQTGVYFVRPAGSTEATLAKKVFVVR